MGKIINDLFNAVDAIRLLADLDLTATPTSSAVDIKGAYFTLVNGVALVSLAGVLTAAEGDYTVTVQTSADGSTGWVAVGFARMTNANYAQPQKIRIRHFEKWLRVVVTENTAETTVSTVPFVVEFVGAVERL